GEVDVGDQLVPGGVLRYSRASDDQWNPLSLLVEVVLELDPVRAELEAVVGGEDEEGLALVPVLADQVDDALHLVVDGEQALQPAAVPAVDVGLVLVGETWDVANLLRLVG